ncbi:MAG: hypothetical protein IPM07_28970 [Anaerolineales bacterium]|nr:hypothetical protein [Anaerolineales bacterium]
MTHQGNRRTFYLFGLLVVLAMVFTACAAPAAGPSTGADGAPPRPRRRRTCRPSQAVAPTAR